MLKYSIYFRIILSCFCFLLLVEKRRAIAQDLSNIDKKNPIKITGGINATQTFYNAWGIQNRRDPYFWLLNANLNIDIAGIYIPFSATFTQQNKSFTQPFNQFGLSPRYKSITLHLGYRSMQFSNFTLGGNIFLGGGIDVAPQNSWVKGSAMYGRLTKAVAVQETEGVIMGEPAYERWGYGTKVMIGKELNRSIDLIMFHGKDKAESIPGAIADSFGLKPAENFILGFVTRQSITQRINFDIEYSLSAFTQDTRFEREKAQVYKYTNLFSPLFETNLSTQFNKAILANLNFTQNLFQFAVSYRRIDPEYRTMGSVFLNNDLEDITGNLSWRMFRNRMNFTVGTGVQRNNLDNELASRMKRFLGNINWSYAVSQKLNLNASYSNFIANTKINNTRITGNFLGLNQNVDSLAYNQITNNASFGLNYNFGAEKAKHVIFTNSSYQKANDNKENSSDFYNLNVGYQYNIIPLGLNFTSAINQNHSIIKQTSTRSFGPTLSVSKLLFEKKLRSTLGITYLITYTNREQSGNNSIWRFANTYKRGRHHSITMDIAYMTRNINTGRGRSFAEFRGNLIYAFIF